MSWAIFIIVVFVIWVAIGHADKSTLPQQQNFGATGKGGVNNPGFLIRSNVNWVGKVDKDGTTHFENFDNLSNGVRAWGVNLFNKMKRGKIISTSSMIDLLTPAGPENPEEARNNYKAAVGRATNWVDLFKAVFDFEANPDWVNASASVTASIGAGFKRSD